MSSLQALVQSGCVTSFHRARVRQALALGPWFWSQRARDFGQAPAEQVGAVLLVTVGDTQSSVWRFGPGEPPGDQHRAPLRGAAEEARHQASRALQRVLPLAWGPERRPEDLGARAHRIDTLPHGGATGICEPVLDGPSCGLSLFLALASLALGRPVPARFAASAALDPQALGRLKSVGAIERKLEALDALVPAVSVLLVARGQEPSARVGRVRVQAVEGPAEALTVVFGEDAFGQHMLETHSPEELAERLFDMIMSSAVSRGEWRPVAAAARLALAQWPALDANTRGRLQLAGAVASRHSVSQWPTEDLPDPDWISGLTDGRAGRAVAHLIQSCTDTGAPEFSTAQRLAAPFLARPGAALEPSTLAVHGAWGRLLAVHGWPGAPEGSRLSEGLRRALAIQRENSTAFLQLGLLTELSYPLSEWLRLSGVLDDHQEFEEACGCLERLQVEISDTSRAYTALARGSSAVLLGSTTGLMALDALAWGRQGDSLRASALRWLAHPRAAGLAGLSRSREDAREALDALAEQDERYLLDVVLSELDTAATAGAADDALARLRGAADEADAIIQHLRGAGANAGQIARCYPY